APLDEVGAARPPGVVAGRPAVARLPGSVLTLGALPAEAAAASREIRDLLEGGGAPSLDRGRLLKVIDALDRAALAATTEGERREEAAAAALALAEGLEVAFLFDASRHLFAIGYRVADGALDEGRYDLLASEARLTSFLCVARGEVPPVHWFRLGRPMTPIELGSALVSWSGSMFEYLMPAIVMHAPEGSLLDQSCRLA